jgi:hypothetical protein
MSSTSGASTTSGSRATGGRVVRFTGCFFFMPSPVGLRGAFGRTQDTSIDFTRGACDAAVGGATTGGAGGATAVATPVMRCVPARFLFLTMVEPDGAANMVGAAI